MEAPPYEGMVRGAWLIRRRAIRISPSVIGLFIVEPSLPTISVTSPNGGETWAPGSTQTIQWTYTGNLETYVKIELLKNGVLNRTIASFASTKKGSYQWKIPANQASATDCRIKITSRSNSSYIDTSDSDFAIGN